jgi:hypothetical protein
MTCPKNDDVVIIDNFFDDEIIDWCLWYFHQFNDRRFNNLKYIQETHWNLPFNKRFGNYVRHQVEQTMPEAKVHSIYIGNDMHPGGVHTDGWLNAAEQDKSYKTILVPLRFNVLSATAIFNERAKQALTLNQVLGLGSDGIDTMTQTGVIDTLKPFDVKTHATYLKHLDINGLSGLTLHSIQHWKPGRAISWLRERWHGPVYFEGTNVERFHVTIMTHTNAE